MSTQFSMLGIINAALLAQGQEEAASENDGSLEWRVLARNWPMVVEAELEDGNYYFTKREANLITRTDGKYGFDDAYLTPSDALHIRHVWIVDGGSRINIDWVQDGSYVHIDNTEGCWVEYIHVGAVDLWTANFTLGIKQKLEAIVLRAIKEEHSEAAAMDQAAEITLQRARTNSSKARSALPMYKKGPIARARMTRG